MATNGIVSVTVNSEVIAKAVAGCNGFNAPRLADHIRKNNLRTAREIDNACRRVSFGCNDCRVIMDRNATITRSDGNLPLPSRYRHTFDDPTFNPRWERGTAAYTEIVTLPPTD